MKNKARMRSAGGSFHGAMWKAMFDPASDVVVVWCRVRVESPGHEVGFLYDVKLVPKVDLANVEDPFGLIIDQAHALIDETLAKRRVLP